MQIDSGFAQSIEVSEDACNAFYRDGFASDLDSVGAEIDGNVQAIFHQS